VAGPPLSIAFLGNDEWSVPTLLAIAESPHRVSIVATYRPRAERRGSALRPTPVARAAAERELPLAEVETVREGDGRRALEGARPDVLVVVAYGELLPPHILTLAPLGAVNVHFSLLPALRGASPVQHALLAGSRRTGVTTIRLDEGLDTGPILLQAPEEIRSEDDAGSLGARLADAGARLLVRTLDGLAEGGLDPRPQDEREATFAPKLAAADRVIRWGDEARSIVNRVRALAPAPAATTAYRSEPLKVFRAAALDDPREANGATSERATPAGNAAGDVVAVGRGGVDVVAGRGVVRLLEVAAAGRRRMAAGDFARGARLRPGERLG
jgi:methionyl-tRNA formyltransferase